jgi:hypothetical protein
MVTLVTFHLVVLHEPGSGIDCLTEVSRSLPSPFTKPLCALHVCPSPDASPQDGLGICIADFLQLRITLFMPLI